MPALLPPPPAGVALGYGRLGENVQRVLHLQVSQLDQPLSESYSFPPADAIAEFRNAPQKDPVLDGHQRPPLPLVGDQGGPVSVALCMVRHQRQLGFQHQLVASPAAGKGERLGRAAAWCWSK